jgi:gliding motility-associated lipoprotein GldH
MKKYALIVIVLFLFSCNNKSVFSKSDSNFPSNQWYKTDSKSFEFSIEDDTKKYDLVFNFGHVYDYQFEKVPMICSIENPNGKTETIPFTLQIKDENGKDAGECLGDICDLQYTIKEKMLLLKGKYKVTIANDFDNTYLPNVSHISFDVVIAD